MPLRRGIFWWRPRGAAGAEEAVFFYAGGRAPEEYFCCYRARSVVRCRQSGCCGAGGMDDVASWAAAVRYFRGGRRSRCRRDDVGTSARSSAQLFIRRGSPCLFVAGSTGRMEIGEATEKNVRPRPGGEVWAVRPEQKRSKIWPVRAAFLCVYLRKPEGAPAEAWNVSGITMDFSCARRGATPGDAAARVLAISS